MKKILIVGLIILVIIILIVVLFLNNKNNLLVDDNSREAGFCFDGNGRQINCEKCIKGGGKIFAHSFAQTCEIKAKDANKKCVYDDECINYVCVYSNKSAEQGYCDDYKGDNDGKEQCHHKRGENIGCGIQFIS
ncbi:MAG: hypothetical protein WCT37_00545 [Patescibacteria group bacterium]|jgi:hypothetical protein